MSHSSYEELTRTASGFATGVVFGWLCLPGCADVLLDVRLTLAKLANNSHSPEEGERAIRDAIVEQAGPVRIAGLTKFLAMAQLRLEDVNWRIFKTRLWFWEDHQVPVNSIDPHRH